MPAPEIIHQLVAKFEENRDAYRSGKYNEAQLRMEFLDKFFEALGWDIYNSKGYSPEYRDVVIEDSLAIEGTSKSPDYTFKIGKERKFYVEAKKPSVDIQYDIHPAYQLRRYAWNAHLPLSVLTDFEEFSIYNCKNKPNASDSAATGRDKYYRYTEYVEKWDEIASIFSKDAVLKGSFDRFAESSKGKKGTTEVDDAFLEDIERWRKLLAYNIALRNPQIKDEGQLNYAVQMTIDRIIFLRICEDKGIEAEEQLRSISKNTGIYDHLIKLFKRADVKYNSGLFHFSREKGNDDPADTFTPGLKIDDKVLKEIINDIYYPCPYIFKEIPVEILGQVYEQFLGKVIKLTEGHQARIEEKPEVRKAGGVYYTPKYIVDYIVQNTVGKLLEGKTPDKAAELKIVDPACGSGSFLLGAYQYLLDWHIKWYIENDLEKWAKGKSPAIVQASGGGWKLTTSKRKEILVNNIHGVDIDPQAVEVTKLSLLLKVLEEESGQLSLGLERVLPDLGKNIQCGNSLIEWDYFEGKLTFDEEERRRVNPFDWARSFPQIFINGGFDAVIGNPPYIRVRIYKEFYPQEAQYLEKHYKCATHIWDIYLLFFEKAVRLLNNNGRSGFIVPIQTLHQPNCESLRNILVTQTSIMSITDLSTLRVFQNAIIKNCILIIYRKFIKENLISIFNPLNPEELFLKPLRSWPQIEILKNESLTMKLDLLSENRNLYDKLLSRSWRLEEICYVTFGMRSCAKGVGNGKKDRLISPAKKSMEDKPYLEGREIKRYQTNSLGRYINYLPSEMYSPRVPELFEAKKIVSQSMLSKKRLIATLDTNKHYVEQSLICIIPHGIITNEVKIHLPPLEFILGIINSKLESFYFSSVIIDFSLGGGLIHATPGSQAKLIIPKAEKNDISKMVELVTRMLTLLEKVKVIHTPQEEEMMKREIQETDEHIDRLVYELFGLTEEEIKIVEGIA